VGKKGSFFGHKGSNQIGISRASFKTILYISEKEFFPCGHTAPPVSVLGTLVSFVLLLHQVDGVTLKKL
jgi:hypothetical protein